jgi:hypothetical protein
MERYCGPWATGDAQERRLATSLRPGDRRGRLWASYSIALAASAAFLLCAGRLFCRDHAGAKKLAPFMAPFSLSASPVLPQRHLSLLNCCRVKRQQFIDQDRA